MLIAKNTLLDCLVKSSIVCKELYIGMIHEGGLR